MSDPRVEAITARMEELRAEYRRLAADPPNLRDYYPRSDKFREACDAYQACGREVMDKIEALALERRQLREDQP